MGFDFYDLLGLTTDATPDEIRTAYFEAARRMHPDANPDPTTNEEFLNVQSAYETLSNLRRRSEYDAGMGISGALKPAVSLNIRTSRSHLSYSTESQVVYALLEVVCTAEVNKAELPPVHVCLVVDRSTSMAGQRMDMVKANVAQALRFLKPHDIVSLVAFSDRAEVILPPTKVSTFSKVENRVAMIQTGGGTEIYQGLLAGIAQLRSGQQGMEAVRQLILMTDGHTYGDESISLKLAEQASREGIDISALGIGHEWNDKFLDRLTSYSGGNTIFISNTKDLTRYLEQKMNSVGAIYAKGITLDFETDPLVEMRYAFRIYPEITPLPVVSPVSLGNLQYGKSLTVLLEFMVSPISEDVDVVEVLGGRLKMQVNDPKMKKARLFVDVKRPVKPNVPSEPPPPAIVEALARLTLYRMQERARQEVDDGDTGQAAKHLQYLATHLLAHGNQELAHTVLIEAEHIRQSHTFSKDGDKRIKYGTRALMLPSGLETRS